jgi:hypothetical protein
MGAVFSDDACYRDASFRLIHFWKPQEEDPDTPSPEEVPDKPPPDPPAKFMKDRSLDLRGLTYDRIYMDLDELLLRIKTSDRQPYTLLEQTLRKIGDDHGADRVYLTRRDVERRQMSGLHLFWDLIYCGLAKYGIPSKRLVGIALLLLMGGIFLFSRPSALQAKEEKKAPTSQGCTQQSVCDGGSTYERYERAFGVSVHQFLPIDVPVGSACVPALRWPSFYGSFLRVAGAILVGVGLGSVSGLLRRVSP